MRRKIKSIIGFADAVFMLISMMGISTAEEIQTEAEKAEVSFFLNQYDSIQTYQAVQNNINKEAYGGMYIDDYGKLNILTTTGNLSAIREVVSKNQEADQMITYRTAKYSIAFLESIQNSLMEVSEKYGISAIEINEFENNLTVYLSKNDAKTKNNIIMSIPNQADYEYLEFELLDEMPTDSATYTLRNGCELSSSAGSFSMGIGVSFILPGTLGTKYGFLTAGHCGNVGDIIRYQGVNMGKIVRKQQFGSVDVAIIERYTSPNTFKCTNLFTDGTGWTQGSLNYVRGGFPAGTKVTKYGKKTGKTTGTIKSTSYSGTVSGVKFTGLVTSTCYIDSGDSGGPVKVESGSGLVYTYAAGINKGYYTSGSKRYHIYTDMTKAKNALGFLGHVD